MPALLVKTAWPTPCRTLETPMRRQTPAPILAPILAFALAALPTLAETPLPLDLQNPPYLKTAKVAGGTLSVAPYETADITGQQLMFNGVPLGLADTYVAIQAVIPRPEFVGEDIVFVTLAGGGNACPTLWAVVVTSDTGAKVSNSFGTCSEAILNPRLTMDALVAFDMAPVGEDQTWMTYTLDGTDIWESELTGAP
jgi:hypothetical protein